MMKEVFEQEEQQGGVDGAGDADFSDDELQRGSDYLASFEDPVRSAGRLGLSVNGFGGNGSCIAIWREKRRCVLPPIPLRNTSNEKGKSE